VPAPSEHELDGVVVGEPPLITWNEHTVEPLVFCMYMVID